jgi:hypothetical protein
MAVDAEEIPGRPVFYVGAREELKTRGELLSSEAINAAVQAERSTPIKVLRSLDYEHSEQARAPHTNGPRDVHRYGALSLLQKTLHYKGG